MRKETVRGTLIAVAIVAALAGSDGIADAVAGDQGDTGTVTAAQMVQAASRGSGIFGSSEAGCRRISKAPCSRRRDSGSCSILRMEG